MSPTTCATPPTGAAEAGHLDPETDHEELADQLVAMADGLQLQWLLDSGCSTVAARQWLSTLTTWTWSAASAPSPDAS
ncbi:TetR family transcriptional regulator C-terminal domain-containing protein [Nonomuraea sp. NPDC003201]